MIYRVPLPWDYDEDSFIGWVEEVFFESYKRNVEPKTADECVDHLRNMGYEVEVLPAQ